MTSSRKFSVLVSIVNRFSPNSSKICYRLTFTKKKSPIFLETSSLVKVFYEAKVSHCCDFSGNRNPIVEQKIHAQKFIRSLIQKQLKVRDPIKFAHKYSEGNLPFCVKVTLELCLDFSLPKSELFPHVFCTCL